VAERFLCDDPTPAELERLMESLPPPPAQALEALRRDFAMSESPAATPAASEWPPLLQEVQGKADVRYAEPPTSDRPLVGPALVFAKRVFRLVGQPFINEALRKQVEFNQAIIAGVGQIYESLQQHLRNQALWRAEVDARLQRLERERERQVAASRPLEPVVEGKGAGVETRRREAPEEEASEAKRAPRASRTKASKRPRKH